MKLKITAVLLMFCSLAYSSNDKKDFSAKYKGKYLVILRDGLAVASCAAHQATGRGDFGIKTPLPALPVKLDGDRADYHVETGFMAMGPNGGCGSINPEPIHKNEIVRVVHAGIYRGVYVVAIESAPHQLDRGVGAFSHQSTEVGIASVGVSALSLEEAEKTLSIWFKVFDSEHDASAQAGNTASGVYVKQIKLSMSVGEVEEVLGPPVARVDLGPKMLYKYKDMTVEFMDGKVSDVR